MQQKYPFTVDAIVLVPDRIHCIWTLPPDDCDYATRWRLIKTYVTKQGNIKPQASRSESRQKRQEGILWQRRFWEHCIRDETDAMLGIVIISITTRCDMDCAIGLPIGSILVFIDM